MEINNISLNINVLLTNIYCIYHFIGPLNNC